MASGAGCARCSSHRRGAPMLQARSAGGAGAKSSPGKSGGELRTAIRALFVSVPTTSGPGKSLVSRLLQWALRMQAAVRQVDLVDRHVDAAQRTFDGVRVIH